MSRSASASMLAAGRWLVTVVTATVATQATPGQRNGVRRSIRPRSARTRKTAIDPTTMSWLRMRDCGEARKLDAPLKNVRSMKTSATTIQAMVSRGLTRSS